MNAKTANRTKWTQYGVCSICGETRKPIRIIRNGKSRMVKTCNCK